jgi:F-type H+-transporting ATPase subunit b
LISTKLISAKPFASILRASFLRNFFGIAVLAFSTVLASAAAPSHAGITPSVTATPIAVPVSMAFVLLDQPRLHGAPTPGKPETNSEEEQEKKFRHSPTIEWFSKLLGLDVETAASIFEWINFAVIALAVGIPLFRWLPKVFRQRSARLSADIEVAQAKTADANDRLAAVEAKLAGLDAEINAIRQQVDEAMRADEVRAKAAIEEETARIVASAEREIVMAGTQAQRGLRKFAADLAIDRALTQLTLDAETDRALIAEFAADIAHGGNGRSGKGAKN